MGGFVGLGLVGGVVDVFGLAWGWCVWIGLVGLFVLVGWLVCLGWLIFGGFVVVGLLWFVNCG